MRIMRRMIMSSLRRVNQLTRQTVNATVSAGAQTTRQAVNDLRSPTSDIRNAEDISLQNLDAHLETFEEELEDSDRDSQNDQGESENVQVEGNKSKSSRSRSMNSKNLSHHWPDEVQYDEKEEVLTVDAEGNNTVLSGMIQPHDIENQPVGVKCIVHFNEFSQPIRKGAHILVKYLSYLGKQERFCPIGEISWPKVNKQCKVEIVKIVRAKFVIPDGEVFDKAILKRVGTYWKNYKYELKCHKFNPTKRSKEAIIKDVPHGHALDSWMRLVEYWFSDKGQKRSECGKKTRASQSHVHTTGSTSYANKQADYVQTNGKEPSHLEFLKLTDAKVGGGFVENTKSAELLEKAHLNVEQRVQNSSPTKSRTEIENEEFDKLIYRDENPKRPVGYGFGVEQSDVFGVHGMLRKIGCGSTTILNRSTDLEKMKEKVAAMEKENQKLRARTDQSNQILLKALDALRSGKLSDEFFAVVQSALRGDNSKVASASTGDSARYGGDNATS